jgi:hypothetical protein
MSAVDTYELAGARMMLVRARRFRALVIAFAAAYGAYFIAVVGGTPTSLTSPLYSVFMLPVPFVVWWAYTRAQQELRRLLHILAWAATLWLVGSLVWYAYYFAGDSKIPEPPGTWDIFLILARLLVIAAVVDAMRSLMSIRMAFLDASVICASTIALGAAFVARGLEGGVSIPALFTLNRPLLGIVTLMLIVSAALGSWQGLPLSIVLMALGEVALTIGSLIYSYEAINGDFVDDRWAGLAWAGGAALSIIAASVIIARVDRPIRVTVRSRIPQHPAGSRPVLLVALTGLLLTLATTLYGLAADKPAVALVGVAAGAWISAAMAFRARNSIRTAENAYDHLDHALRESERSRDELAAANQEFARANAELQTLQIAIADVLNLADERSDGRIRELIEDTGRDLADLLEQELDQTRGR